MNKTLKISLKIFFYSTTAVVLFYLSFWIFFTLAHSFPSYFTVYSEHFDEEAFQKIRIGEDKKVVESKLGKPLRESISNINPDSIKDIFWYSKGRYSTSYDKIFIVFYDNKVDEKIRVTDGD